MKRPAAIDDQHGAPSTAGLGATQFLRAEPPDADVCLHYAFIPNTDFQRPVPSVEPGREWIADEVRLRAQYSLIVAITARRCDLAVDERRSVSYFRFRTPRARAALAVTIRSSCVHPAVSHGPVVTSPARVDMMHAVTACADFGAVGRIEIQVYAG